MKKAIFLAGTAILFTSNIAFAQTGPSEAPASTPADQSTTGLEDIIVTAQRKVETAQKAALPVSVVSGSDLSDSGITASNRLSQAVPALTLVRIGAQSAAFIRGVGNFSVTSQSDPAVAFNYDGVYIGRNTATITSYFDLDRIEVLKGPQGTLYGRNATAGAINIIPVQPKYGEFSGFGSASYGNYDAVVLEGAVNAPLGENGALRVSGTYINRDGYLKDGTSDDKSHGLRVQLKSDLTPSLTVRAAFDYSHIGGMGYGTSYLNTYTCSAVTTACTVTPLGIPVSDGVLSPRSQAFWQSRPVLTVPGRKYNPFPDLFQQSNFYGGSVNIEYDTGAGVLTIIPAARFDEMKGLAVCGAFPCISSEKHDQYSVETRFAGKISLFDYTLGFFYFDEESRGQTQAQALPFSASFQGPLNVATKSYAPFVRLTANLTPRLRIVGGARYTHDRKKFDATVTGFTEICVLPSCPNAILPPLVLYPSQLGFNVPAPGGPPVPGPTPGTIISRSDVSFSQRKTFEKVTWRGAVEYDVAPASMLYASVETGFRSGGFSTSVGYETYQPEYITAYTIGSKNRFFNNRVQLNAELFWWDYSNQQVAKAGVDLLNRPGNFTQNIGKSRIRGLEVDGRFLVTTTTEISADVQYLDSKFTSFVYQAAKSLGYPRTLCGVSTNASNATLYDINCSGKPAYNAPKWTVNFSAQQTVPLGDYKIVFGANTQYRSGRFVNAEFGPEQYQSSSWTSNAQVTFGPEDNMWSLQAFVRNIENDRLLVSATQFNGLQAAYTSPPRTYGVRGLFKF
ncbi:TonB-dependent receptor [Sphingobium sp. SCG-1]|uniref:TonB-dependent receptor n=1 Tax=Sphingobium sp. SCG-1 TaxID=2072936 RepID=UPI000CD6C10D|nr:TonB-dependent receptor [Sphingobium sp. SCG-1]AUW57788.1 TonB-dependent receptor [Sphingobium sp. SCG-1]